tara:strand:+ start:394 stop:756 length:363 start_codon:yes stop_codon:yes gene_type:complete
LINKLTSISDLLNNTEEDYKIRIEFYMEQVFPYLSKYFQLVNMDQRIDYSSWSEMYLAKKITESPFPAKYAEVDLLELENLMYQHKINSDFALLGELKMRKFFKETLEIIDNNLELKKSN